MVAFVPVGVFVGGGWGLFCLLTCVGLGILCLLVLVVLCLCWR